MGISSGNKWTSEDSVDLYNIDRWGCGYFGIDENGDLAAKIDPDAEQNFRILDAVQEAQRQGFHAPFIVRFPKLFTTAFGRSMERLPLPSENSTTVVDTSVSFHPKSINIKKSLRR